MDYSFSFAGFFEKKSENTQKKYIRDAITQRETGYRKEKFRRTKSYFWVMCKRRKYGMLKVKNG